jgi:hypothetical protein
MPRVDPGNLNYIGLAAGDVRYFQVTGSTSGWVWGTDVYTTDSNLATAAVHAGILKAGSTGLVKVTILRGQSSHSGSTRNGVTSMNYGSWSLSMRLAPVDAQTLAAVGKIHQYNGTFLPFSPTVGQTLRFQITGSDFGSVWGTDVYTTDSHLNAAAVHAGVLKVGESGVVCVKFEPGLTSYTSSTRHGVSSLSWSAYSLSFRVQRDATPTPPKTPE